MCKVQYLVEEYCKGRYDHDAPDFIWHSVFKYIAEHHKSLNFCKVKMQLLWTVNGGHLRRKIQDEQLIAKFLTLTMPGYEGEGLVLYRGECEFLFEDGKIGFCWTPDIKVAMMFASGLNALESRGVLLKAYAPPEAIFSPPNAHSVEQMQEFEYTCNPYLLKNIEVLKIYEQSLN